MLRPAPAVDVLELFGEERAELTALLRSLEAEKWAAATACEGWSVHDLTLHLVAVDLSLLSRRRDGFEGARIESSDDLVAALDEHNEEWVRTARRLSPRVTIELLDLVAPLMQSFYESSPADAEAEGVSWADLDPAPHWMSVGREFTERWIHQQQIRDAVGRPGLNGPRFVAPVLALLLRSVVPAYRDVPAERDSTVAISIQGRAGGNWALVRKDEGWELYEGRASEPNARVSCDQDTAWRFLTRNLSRAEAQPKIELEGKLAQPFMDSIAAIVKDR
jgi:uncharacterized protein (TIGR03083 family)